MAKGKRFLAWIELEFLSSLSFPIPEMMVFFILFAGIVVGLDTLRIGMTLTLDLQLTSYSMLVALEGLCVNVLSSSAISISFVILFFVPLLTSLSIAKEFEVGTMRTISSYPISRQNLLFIKLGTVLLIVCFFVTIAETLPVLVLIGYVDVFQFLGPILTALTLQIWIILSITSLISLLSRNSAFSTLVGIGLGYIMMMSSIFNIDYPLPLRTILYPIIGFQELYIYGEAVLSDLYLGFVGGVIIGFALLLLCIFVFSRMEL